MTSDTTTSATGTAATGAAPAEATATAAPDAAAPPGLGYGDILARLRALEPVIRERAAEIEGLRRMPRDLVESLRRAGAFRLAMPAEWGGPDLDSVRQTEIVEEVARMEPSVGWCVMIGMDSGIYVRYLDPAVARALYPHPDMITAGWVPPMGRAHEVAGGYRLEGHWRFGSGLTHADWIAAGCAVHRDGEMLTGPDGNPVWRVLLAPPEAYTVVDTWRTTGLAGTGSLDYTVEDLFVPAERSFSFDAPVARSPLTRRSDAIVRKMPGVPLGAARGAIDYVLELAAKRVDQPGDVPWPGSPRVQRVIGECELRLAAARSFVYASLEEQWAHLVEGRDLDRAARARAALSRYNAFRAARDICGTLYDLVGGDAVYTERTPLDRRLRDAITATQHVVGQDRILQWCGELVLGGEPDTPFI